MGTNRARTGLMLVMGLGALSVVGQLAHPKASVRPMRQIYVEDQRDRGVSLSDDGTPMGQRAGPQPRAISTEDLQKRDAERRQRTLALLRAGKITTAEDFHDAAYIYQHGETADDYLLAHILAIEAIVKGDTSSKWIAATLDRFLQDIGRPQVFGTQYLSRDYLFVKQHQKDPEAMKHHTPETGMTQEPYESGLLPDLLRLDFCVPDIAQQKLNLKAFEAGKYPTGIVPPGCTR